MRAGIVALLILTVCVRGADEKPLTVIPAEKSIEHVGERVKVEGVVAYVTLVEDGRVTLRFDAVSPADMLMVLVPKEVAAESDRSVWSGYKDKTIQVEGKMFRGKRKVTENGVSREVDGNPVIILEKSGLVRVVK